MTVDDLIVDVLRREGGYTDHPADKGGATNFGISLRYATGIGLDLDGDGDTDADDIRLVTADKAARLYRMDFYTTPRIDTLPEPIQPVTFDWAVNSGPPRAIMGVQSVLVQAGFLPNGPRALDGVIGPKTRQAAGQAQSEMGPYFVNAIVCERENFYRRIVRNRPDQAVFLKGWLNRAGEFRVTV
jgi:lysozyme family protein